MRPPVTAFEMENDSAAAGGFDVTGKTAGAVAPELGAAPRRPMATAAAKVARKTSAGSARRPQPGSTAEASALAAGAQLQGIDLTANSIMPDVFKQFGTVTRPDGAFGDSQPAVRTN